MKRSLKRWLAVAVVALFHLQMFGQGNSAKSELPKGWHLMDKEKDGVYGISLDKAYEFIKSKNLK
ncbi:MAG TPA: hypothetical protein VMI35_05835, partial [Puia sp.]|nr:hypothetical protein [Puia sp.]